ncbi:MAG: cytochrome b N-terminal domain-containing protein [Candidatus Melainabacteria bacterium]|nr:cytochrome b N-terminal domain-containing protein [Candidatus Melainabacteria bacterium]
MLESIIKKLKERFPLEKINFESLILKKEVPVHKASWIYYLGGMTMLCFLIQLVTGLLLLPYYQPTIVNAFQSIEYLNHYVPYGFLVRNLHAWSSSFMIFFAVIHLLTVFATKSYQKPREFTWITGVLLMAVTLGFGFSGYLLPWHQIAVNATKVGMEILQSSTSFLPGIFKLPGEVLAMNLRGGAIITQTTLSRFYAIHVVILPFIFFALVGIHLFLVQMYGMNKEISEVKKSEKFFPDFFIKDLITTCEKLGSKAA